METILRSARDLAAVVAHARAAAGLSQGELAARAGALLDAAHGARADLVDSLFVASLERAEDPTVEQLLAILGALGCELGLSATGQRLNAAANSARPAAAALDFDIDRVRVDVI